MFSKIINLTLFKSPVRNQLFKQSKYVNTFLLNKNFFNIKNRNYCDLKVDLDLNRFLQEEIRSEKELNKLPKNGPGIPGFEIKTDGASVILTRKQKNDLITVKFNVNASVNDESSFLNDEQFQEKQEQDVQEMKSKPDFFVEIKKPNNKTLSFSCCFLENTEEAEQEKVDLFEIQNFFIQDNNSILNDIKESVYMGDASIIDGQLYDLLMDYLDERGIGDEFAENLVEFASYYEHTLYVELLEKIQNFVSKK